MDALNQVPNYFIRGEQVAAFYHFYEGYNMLLRSWNKTTLYFEHMHRDPQHQHQHQHRGEEDDGGYDDGDGGGGGDGDANGRPDLAGQDDRDVPNEVLYGTAASGAADADVLTRGSVSGGASTYRGYRDLREAGQQQRQQQRKPGPQPLPHASEHRHDLPDPDPSPERAHPDPEREEQPLGFAAAKSLYERLAVGQKLPWFNDMQPARVLATMRSLYTLLYGYHGPHVVSGFKEIRFSKGSALPRGATYADFCGFLDFLRSLCGRGRVLLNSRASWRAGDNVKLARMFEWDSSAEQLARFEGFLRTTHEWYDRYAEEHAADGSAMRVVMEDMFDAQKNETLARDLLTFLGEDPDRHRIRFTRMPYWG